MRISDWSSDVCSSDRAQAMLLRQRSNLALFHPAERKPQIIELPRRGGEKKIALVARGVDRPVQFRPPRTNDAPHIMVGDETIRPQILRDLQKIGEPIGRSTCRERVCQYV